MVCPKCGKQFEGVFCPWCGSSAESAELEKRSDEEIAAEEEAFKAEETLKAEEEKKSAEQDAAQKQAEEAAVASGEKIRCPKCGNVFSGNFCPACGAKAIEIDRCPVCGAPHNAGDKFCAKCGYSYVKKPSAAAVTMAGIGAAIKNSCKSALAFCKKYSKKVIAAAVAIALILVIVVPISVVFTSPVHPANVDRIKIGDTQERVLSILGDPYDWEEGDLTFDYYSNNYLKIRKQLDEIANMDDMESFGDLADALEKEEKLNAKLETLEYKQTRVSFDEDGLVEKIVFNASARERSSDEEDKELKSKEILTESVRIYERSDVIYTLKYKDKSIVKAKAQITPEELSDSYTFSIDDPFAPENEIEFSCKVVENPNILYNVTINDVKYYLTADGTLTISGSGTASYEKGAAPAKAIIIEEGITGIENFYEYDNAISIIIPDTVTEIKCGAFAGSDSLTTLSVNSGNAKYHSSGNCVIETQSKTLISGCKNSTIPDDGSVTNIASYAFGNCIGLTSIVVPDSVTSIGSGAFSGCSGLESITIPFVGGSVKTSSDTYQYPFGYIFGTSSYEGGVETYQNYADNLETRFYIPSSLKSVIVTGGNISRGAFYNCSSLTSITIPDSVTSIGNYAFEGCSSLESITIGNNVTSIGNSVFAGCSSLEIIIVEEGNTVYHSEGNCLIETDSKTLIVGCKNSVIPSDGSVTSIGRSAFFRCRSLISITIPDSVTSIGGGAFGGCSSLTSIVIPDSVTSIGGSAFSDCSSLESINIPDSVTSIGRSAFEGCDSLTNIVIPDNVTSIGDRAFFGCSSLTSITIGGSVRSIGDYAFYNCDSLKSVTIGDGVTSIGEYAFQECSSLTSINFQGSMKQWKAIDKESDWNDVTGSYTVTCTDGTLDKNGDQVS